eukprot:988126_1
MATKDALEKLVAVFNISNNVLKYKIPQRIFDSYSTHVYSVVKKKCNKGVNFGRVKNEMDQAKTWAIFKGYWFHNAPKEMAKTLWIPVLKNISKYFHNIGKLYHSRQYTESQIEMFLKLMFVKNMFEVKCQINSQSNPGGPVIQYAAWKIESMQQILNNYFDTTYVMKWDSWLRKKGCNGKKMRINTVIKQLVKPFAQKQFKEFIVSTDRNMEFSEFCVEGSVIERMNLAQYFGEEDDDEKSQSDQSLNSNNNNMSVEENITNEIMPRHNNIERDNISYNGYHGVMDTHSDYRYHPYAMHKKHIKCRKCGKCKHHCICDDVALCPIIPSQDPYPYYSNSFGPYPYYSTYAHAVPPYAYYNDVNGSQYQYQQMNNNYNYNIYNDHDNSTQINMGNYNIYNDRIQNDNINNFHPAVPNDYAFNIPNNMPNNTLLPSSDHDMSSY